MVNFELLVFMDVDILGSSGLFLLDPCKFADNIEDD